MRRLLSVIFAMLFSFCLISPSLAQAPGAAPAEPEVHVPAPGAKEEVAPKKA